MKKIFLALMVLVGLAVPLACSNNNNPTTPALTATPAPVATNWAGYTNTATPTSTITATPTITNTGGFTSTFTPIPTSTPTATITTTGGNTSTFTAIPTNTATTTATLTPTNTATLTPTGTPTSTFVTTPPTIVGTSWSTGNYSPQGLSANTSGATFVYVAEEGLSPNPGQVEIFNSSGVSQGLLPTVAFGDPSGTAVDNSGNIYVVDQVNNAVYIFNSSNVYQSTLTSWTPNPSGPASFRNPEGIAVDSANLYVADTGNDEIEVFTLGSFSSPVTEWGGTGSGNGTFNNPSAVALDGSGNLYVADASNQLIQMFTTGTFSYSNQFLTAAGSDIYGIAVSGPNLYAADVANSQVEIYGLGGGNFGDLLAAGPGTTSLNSPSPDGVIVFGGGILVSDFNNNAVYKFLP